MDIFEGVSSGHYLRQTVEVVTRSGEAIEAVTYIAAPEHVCDEQAPSADYLERIVRGAREHGLPEKYVRWIESLGEEQMSVEEEFAVLASSVVALVKTVPWQTDKKTQDAAGLFIKLYNHVSSAFHLARGMHSPTSTEKQYDFASVFVLCRAAFETFLRFYHIFVQPIPQDERDCRYYGWILSSLLRKQKYPATLEENKEILAAEKGVITDIEKRLAANPCYQGLTPKERRSLRWDGKLDGWSKIADDAGQDDWTAKHSYDYLCGHAHSGAASVLQICQAAPEKSKELINTGLEMCLISMAFMLDAFTKVYAQGRGVLSDQQIQLIEKWKYFGTQREPREGEGNE